MGYMAGVPRVVYRGEDGHIYELSIDPGRGWILFDMTVAINAPLAAGDPRGFVAGTARVDYRGRDGHIHEIYIDGSHWAHFDLSAATNAPLAAGDPHGHLAGSARVDYRGRDGHIHEITPLVCVGWTGGEVTWRSEGRRLQRREGGAGNALIPSRRKPSLSLQTHP
jgi:hypothetical protein